MGLMTFVKNLIVKSGGLGSDNGTSLIVEQTPRKVRVPADTNRPLDRRKTRKRNAKGQFVRDIRRNFQA
jgi:hypothetical protein